MTKKIYLIDTKANFTIPEGFVYCSVHNLGSGTINLKTNNGEATLLGGATFELPEDLQGYESLIIQIVTEGKASIAYKMK